MSDQKTQSPNETRDETPALDQKRGQNQKLQPEKGGPKGPEPTRFGDWEKNGIASDF
ncbi:MULTISPECIES: succinate dehydrogenase assembly factor 4 [unclassified Iodidimonas]|jgi:hypothetical protein|uniref:DUF1674 domain-containing protein n=1 Tax=unclassified Iodidimonas TaxID=2626145 RepID=UPI0024825E33|nr:MULTISPECIES: succinate dehydrogenase assembly factor 4 [unclassified Iodidimonas]